MTKKLSLVPGRGANNQWLVEQSNTEPAAVFVRCSEFSDGRHIKDAGELRKFAQALIGAAQALDEAQRTTFGDLNVGDYFIAHAQSYDAQTTAIWVKRDATSATSVYAPLGDPLINGSFNSYDNVTRMKPQFVPEEAE